MCLPYFFEWAILTIPSQKAQKSPKFAYMTSLREFPGECDHLQWLQISYPACVDSLTIE